MIASSLRLGDKSASSLARAAASLISSFKRLSAGCANSPLPAALPYLAFSAALIRLMTLSIT